MESFDSPLCMSGTPRSKEKDVWVQGLLAQPSPHVTSLRPYFCHGQWASQSLRFRTSTLSRIVAVQSPVFLTHHRHHVVDSDLTEILKDHDACLKGDRTGLGFIIPQGMRFKTQVLNLNKGSGYYIPGYYIPSCNLRRVLNPGIKPQGRLGY